MCPCVPTGLAWCSRGAATPTRSRSPQRGWGRGRAQAWGSGQLSGQTFCTGRRRPEGADRSGLHLELEDPDVQVLLRVRLDVGREVAELLRRSVQADVERVVLREPAERAL